MVLGALRVLRASVVAVAVAVAVEVADVKGNHDH
jgi:hypothetical protein